MGGFIDLTGQRFGRLTVVKRSENNKQGSVRWECLCECGNQKIVGGGNLRNGTTKSCGCLNKEKTTKRNKSKATHGESRTRLYQTWRNMIRRCKPDSDDSKHYFDRGITIVDEWYDFLNFKEWAMENGYSDSLTIDRIDNGRGYSPENCRWADIPTQNRNKRSNVVLSFRGEEKILTDWCKELNLNRGTVHSRLNRDGWSVERALSTPTGTGFK